MQKPIKSNVSLPLRLVSLFFVTWMMYETLHYFREEQLNSLRFAVANFGLVISMIFITKSELKDSPITKDALRGTPLVKLLFAVVVIITAIFAGYCFDAMFDNDKDRALLFATLAMLGIASATSLWKSLK